MTESNPYGLAALWAGSDLVAKLVLLMMVVMSAASWYVIVVKWLEQQRMLRQARAAESFWQAASIAQGAEQLERGSPLRFIAQAGVEASGKHAGLLGRIDLHTWITMSIQRAIERVQGRLQNGLALHKNFLITGTFGQEEAYRRVSELMRSPERPTAFFIANNHSELGFLSAMRDLRLKIPADAAFVGFDELPGQLLFELPYSCLDREVTMLGAKAAQLREHRNAALCLHWKTLRDGVQVRTEGVVEKTSAPESDAYFATRARASRA